MDKAIRQKYRRFLRNQGFLHGVGSIMNIWPAAPSPEVRLKQIHPYASDREALSGDWQRVGQDMWRAIGKVRQRDGVERP